MLRSVLWRVVTSLSLCELSHDNVIASWVAMALIILLLRMTLQTKSLSSVNGAWLLPMVAAVVASATGSLLADALPNPSHALWTITTSYLLLGMSLPMAFMVTTLYFMRLLIHEPPPKEIIMSGLITLGPLGSGSFAFLQLKNDARQTLPQIYSLADSNLNAWGVLHAAVWMVALLLCELSVFWLFVAVACIVRQRPEFNMSWWGLTFPLGVFAAAILQIGAEIPSRFFEVLGTVRSLLIKH